MSNVTLIKPPPVARVCDFDTAETAILQARGIVDLIATIAADNGALGDGPLMHACNAVLWSSQDFVDTA